MDHARTSYVVCALMVAASLGASSASAAEAPGLSPLYAPLFEAGGELALRVTTHAIQYTGGVGGPDEGTGYSSMRCRVEAVRTVGKARASHVSCTQPDGGLIPLLGGVWLGNARGAWLLPAGEWPPSLETVETELRVEAPRLAARPVAGTRRVEVEQATGDEEGCLVVTKRAKVKVWGGQERQAWCVMEECTMGDEASYTTCWVAGAGPLRFEAMSAGGGFELTMSAVVEPKLPGEVVGWARPEEEVPQGVKALVARWVGTQNAGDVKGYRGLFAEGFVGIKRTRRGSEKRYDRAAWLKDRGAMIERGQQVVVREAKARVKGEGAVVRFMQYWSSATYADKGEKELVLKRVDGVWRVVGEEMKQAARWDGRY